MTLLERLYFVEIFKGVLVTSRHLIGNLARYLLSVVGIKTKERPWATIEYPNEHLNYSPRFRGRHRLTLHDNGSVKCTACFLCATACPAKCIYIKAAEHDDPNIEKFPDRYEIDTLLCIYCGYCVDACPVDAIRMDTGIHPEIYPADPRAFIEDKETLMLRSKVLETKGAEALMQEHLQHMQDVEKNPFSSNY
ncbi:4Fe-4S dicluster domain-containing protein [bacterium]|nr:4Fe-4S dicluster domain-containing protein [bacterium]